MSEREYNYFIDVKSDCRDYLKSSKNINPCDNRDYLRLKNKSTDNMSDDDFDNIVDIDKKSSSIINTSNEPIFGIKLIIIYMSSHGVLRL